MPELLATALSAVRTDDLSTARSALNALNALAEDGGDQNRLAAKEVAASIEAATGNAERAIALMDEAIAIVETLRPPNGAASPVKPVYELYGEILLAMGNAEDALAKFDTSLLRLPNRMRSRLGAARAASEMGLADVARTHYAALTEYWVGDDDHPALREAQQFIRTN